MIDEQVERGIELLRVAVVLLFADGTEQPVMATIVERRYGWGGTFSRDLLRCEEFRARAPCTLIGVRLPGGRLTPPNQGDVRLRAGDSVFCAVNVDLRWAAPTEAHTAFESRVAALPKPTVRPAPGEALRKGQVVLTLPRWLRWLMGRE